MDNAKHKWGKSNHIKTKSDQLAKIKISLMWKPESQRILETALCDNKFLIIIRAIQQKIQISRHFKLLQIIPGIFPVFQATKKIPGIFPVFKDFQASRHPAHDNSGSTFNVYVLCEIALCTLNCLYFHHNSTSTTSIVSH